MRICVLQPSYAGSANDYQHYDPPRDLSSLLPEHSFHHAFLEKRWAFRQLRELRSQGFDVFVNLCEGYPDSDIVSIDVIHSMDCLNVAYTGPGAALYDPPKDLMKLAAVSEGVAVPDFAVVRSSEEIDRAAEGLAYPLFVKPNHAGDSFGIDRDSLVHEPAALRRKALALLEEYGDVLVESYIGGREFTVLMVADPDPGRPPEVLLPLEFRFPRGESFKTYDLKVRQYHPECNVPCREPDLDARLRDAARRVFTAFSGEGYARMDFRVSPDGTVWFLEVNFVCSVFYPDGPEGLQGSADYILQYDGMGHRGFLERIIAEGLARHARRQRPFAVRRGPVGFGVFATRAIRQGEVVFAGEGRAQRVVTRGHVRRTWSAEQQDVFARYAYPVGPEVCILWDKDPAEWAPQNHSCDPNTAFVGLNVVARRAIAPGEELTLDYGTFCGPEMAPFECRCGSAHCRGRITGQSPALRSPAEHPCG